MDFFTNGNMYYHFDFENFLRADSPPAHCKTNTGDFHDMILPVKIVLPLTNMSLSVKSFLLAELNASELGSRGSYHDPTLCIMSMR